MKKERYYISACHTCGGNCWGCWYSDGCPTWESTGIGETMIEVLLTKEELADYPEAIPSAEFDEGGEC